MNGEAGPENPQRLLRDPAQCAVTPSIAGQSRFSELPVDSSWHEAATDLDSYSKILAYVSGQWVIPAASTIESRMPPPWPAFRRSFAQPVTATLVPAQVAV